MAKASQITIMELRRNWWVYGKDILWADIYCRPANSSSASSPQHIFGQPYGLCSNISKCTVCMGLHLYTQQCMAMLANRRPNISDRSWQS